MGKSLSGKELGTGLSQRKNGLYVGRFTNRYGERVYIYGKTLREVKANLRQAQHDDDKCVNIIDDGTTLDEWFPIFMTTFKRRIRNSTRERYRQKYSSIKKELGWRKLTALDIIIMQPVFNEMPSNDYRKKAKALLVEMLDKAVEADRLVKNPAKAIEIDIEEEEEKERRVLTEAETEILLQFVKDKTRMGLYYNLVVVGLNTGMRIGELCGLKWEDIDFAHRRINVKRTMCLVRVGDEDVNVFEKENDKCAKYVLEFHPPKTKSSIRTIPMTTSVVNALEKQEFQNKINFTRKHSRKKSYRPLQEQFKDLVFFSRTNQPIIPDSFYEYMCGVSERIALEHPGFEKATPHAMRHTFATRAIERGINPKTLQKILGHARLQTTMDTYCHVTEDTLYNEMDKFEKADNNDIIKVKTA